VLCAFVACFVVNGEMAVQNFACYNLLAIFLTLSTKNLARCRSPHFSVTATHSHTRLGVFIFGKGLHLVTLLLHDICTETNQIEDPRLKWREEQEHMLKEYLADASQDLAVSLLVIFPLLLNWCFPLICV